MPEIIAAEIIEFVSNNQNVRLIGNHPVINLQLPFGFCINHEENALEFIDKSWRIANKVDLLTVLTLLTPRIVNANQMDLAHIEDNREIYFLIGRGK